jgi:hypothetical protein
MTDCNATLTTATETEGRGVPRGIVPPDGVYRIKDGVIVANVTLYTMTCKRSRGCPTGQHPRWTDDWDGATAHFEPLVTDAEVEAAVVAWELMQENFDSPHADIRRALEAAAKVRQETEGVTP